jgi:hypothetical protein
MYDGVKCIIDHKHRFNSAWRAFIQVKDFEVDINQFTNIHSGIDFISRNPDGGEMRLGFHTGHLCDVPDIPSAKFTGAKLRTLDYVVTQLHALVKQYKNIANK